MARRLPHCPRCARHHAGATPCHLAAPNRGFGLRGAMLAASLFGAASLSACASAPVEPAESIAATPPDGEGNSPVEAQPAEPGPGEGQVAVEPELPAYGGPPDDLDLIQDPPAPPIDDRVSIAAYGIAPMPMTVSVPVSALETRADGSIEVIFDTLNTSGGVVVGSIGNIAGSTATIELTACDDTHCVGVVKGDDEVTVGTQVEFQAPQW